MKKIKKTKEEKKAIKNYKEEERQRKLEFEKEQKESKSLRKEHLYLVAAFLILALLIALLIYMLFYSRTKAVIIPDLPTNESINVGTVDFDDEDAAMGDLNTKKLNKLSVTYKIVPDYYKEGILLSNTQVELFNDSFIITSGALAEKPFISSVSKDGKLNWLTKLSDKEYGDIEVNKTIFLNNHFYVFGTSNKNNKQSLIVIKLQNNGKKVTTKTLLPDYNGKIKDIVTADKKIALIVSDASEIKVLFTDEELSDNKNEVFLSKYIDNESYLNYHSGAFVDNNLSLVINNAETFYSVKIDLSTYSAIKEEFSELNNLNTNKSLRVSNYLNGYTAYTNDTVYKFDANNKLINKFDYSTLKLEDDEDFKEKYKDDEFFSSDDLTNEIYIEEIKNNKDNLIVNTKTLFSSIYDIYDSNLKVSKRIILDTFNYSYSEMLLLNSFFIDDSIYEVYSYGTETPSIMISKIG